MPENDKLEDFLESIDEEGEKEEKEEGGQDSHKRFVVCPRCGRKVKNKPITLKSHEKYCSKKYAKMEKEKAKSALKAKGKAKAETVIVKPPIPPKPVLPKKDKNPDSSDREPGQKLPIKAKKDSLKIAGFEMDMPLMIIIGGLMAAGLLILRMLSPAIAEKPRQTAQEAQGAPQESKPVVEEPPARPEPPKPVYSLKI